MSAAKPNRPPTLVDRAERSAEHAEPFFGLRDALAVVWAYRKMIAAVLLTTIGVTLFTLWLRDDAFEVGSKILVRYGRDAVSPRSEVSSSTAQFMPAIRPDLATEADLIRSLALIEAVVDELNLDEPRAEQPPEGILRRTRFELKRLKSLVVGWGNEVLYLSGIKRRLTPRESAIATIAEALAVEFAPESSVLEVSFVSIYRDEAPVVLNALVDLYRQRRASSENNPTEVAFYRDQVESNEERLRERESELEDVKLNYGVFVDLSDQSDMVLRYYLEAQQALRAVEAELSAAQARINEIEEQMQSVEPLKRVTETGERNELLDVLQQRRSELVLEREGYAAKFQDGHPSIQTLDDQIAKIDEMLNVAQTEVAKSFTTGVNPTFEMLERSLLEARQQHKSLTALQLSRQERFEELAEQLAGLRGARVEYAQRQREVALEELTYGSRERRLEEAIAGEAITAAGATNIVVIDPAVVPIKPVGLRKSYILAGSAGAGLILALGLAFGFAGLDDRVFDAVQLEKSVGTPVVGVVGLGSEDDPHTGSKLEQAAFELASFVRKSDPPVSTAALVGANPGAGASTLAIAFRSGVLRRYGLRTVSAAIASAPGEGASPRRIPIESSVQAGSTPTVASDASERDLAALAETMLAYGETDLVLFDVTADPDQSSSFAREVVRKAGSCDLRLLVVEAGRSTLTTVREIVREFERAGRPLDGVILNKTKPRLPRFLGGQG